MSKWTEDVTKIWRDGVSCVRSPVELMVLGLWLCWEGAQTIPGVSGWSGLCICARCEHLDSSIPCGQLATCPFRELAGAEVSEAPLGCSTAQNHHETKV